MTLTVECKDRYVLLGWRTPPTLRTFRKYHSLVAPLTVGCLSWKGTSFIEGLLNCHEHWTDLLLYRYVCYVGAKMNKEQRGNNKFCFKLGKHFTKTIQLMKHIYGGKTPRMVYAL